MAAARRAVQARLTPEARDAWAQVCVRRNVTLTGLLEALGEWLAAGDDSWIRQDIYERAREIDRQRYWRRRP